MSGESEIFVTSTLFLIISAEIIIFISSLKKIEFIETKERYIGGLEAI
jgi:hypothetical protein